MSKEVDVVIRDGDRDGEMGQYVMTIVPQPGQDVEDAVKASEMEVWAHNHGPKEARNHGEGLVRHALKRVAAHPFQDALLPVPQP